jgi:hypothetical protein
MHSVDPHELMLGARVRFAQASEQLKAVKSQPHTERQLADAEKAVAVTDQVYRVALANAPESILPYTDMPPAL